MILLPSKENIFLAAEVLRRGECVGLPTETVYGLAGDGLNPVAVARIFETKNRPAFDPLILHVPVGYDLSRIVSSVPLEAQRLMEKFWPGPLTLVLPRTPAVPDLVTSGLETVAIRCPDHDVAQALLKHFNGPLAAPSANTFGRLSPTTAEAVDQELGDKISMVLDGGPCRVGVESTIVDCTSIPLKILRLGALPVEELESAAGAVEVLKNNDVIAPGMLEHHYAPRTPLYLCDNVRSGSIPPEAVALAFSGESNDLKMKVLSAAGDLRQAAACLFSHLRELDHSGVSLILAEWVPEKGLGRAINDRLKKARAGSAQWDGSRWIFSPR